MTFALPPSRPAPCKVCYIPEGHEVFDSFRRITRQDDLTDAEVQRGLVNVCIGNGTHSA